MNPVLNSKTNYTTPPPFIGWKFIKKEKNLKKIYWCGHVLSVYKITELSNDKNVTYINSSVTKQVGFIYLCTLEKYNT